MSRFFEEILLNFPTFRAGRLWLLIMSRRKKIKGYIFRAWRYAKDGTKLWARDYGYKAWRIPIYEK